MGFYTPSTTISKFGEMWDWTNQLLDHRNKPIKKFKAIAHMVKLLDQDTKEHFRMALVQSLREERSVWLRRLVITILALNFSWNDLEWTFYSHEERCPEDQFIIESAEMYCKSIFEKTVMQTIIEDKFKEALSA